MFEVKHINSGLPKLRTVSGEFVRSWELAIMMNDDNETVGKKPTRGRPRGTANAHVIMRLLDVTDTLLQECSHVDLTERRVAAAAGVDDRMINYYFRDKDGLIFAVIERYCDSLADSFAALDAIAPSSHDATRQIYKILVCAYYSKPWIARILASELARNQSPIKESFTRKYGLEGQALGRIRDTFERLRDCGVYDSTIDAAQSALALFMMSLAPVLVGPFFANVGADSDWFKQDRWLDYVAALFDESLRRRNL
jgi:AcrR family transcriptional regulator